MEGLSVDQQNRLLHFQELSGIDDLNGCIQLLAQANWDLEVAIQTHLSVNEGFESAFAEQHAQHTDRVPEVEQLSPRLVSNLHSPELRRQRREEQQVGVFQGFYRWITQLFLLPFRFSYSTIMSAYTFMSNLIRPDPRTIVVDPEGDVRGFVEDYENRYGPVHPAWMPQTYGDALSSARSNIRFLFIYLHNENHSDTELFCRNTLTNHNLVDLLNRSAISWACSVNTPEGYRVSRALRADNQPFVALVALRQNRMTLVARSEGFIEADELRTRLERIMDAAEPELVAARAARDERELNQTIRLQQDEAYLESLRADQEKARRRREEEEEERRQAEEVRRAQEQELRRQQEVEDRKELIRNRMNSEPDESDPDIIKIVVKLPNGTRLERRFRRSESLSSLYDFIFVHEAAPDDFQVVSSFPRRVIPCQPTSDNPVPPSFAEYGFSKAEMLLVLDNQA